MSFSLNYAIHSDVGLVRASNQDSAYAGPNILVVADGMGGHAGGDVASCIAIEALRRIDSPGHQPATAVEDLAQAVEHARVALIQASILHPELHGMGTTVTALMRCESNLILAHMGDSRAYVLRDGQLAQITADHTYVQHLVDTGRITEQEAAHHPQRNVVMRVLGDFDLELAPDISVRPAHIGERWLLCSDGLSGFVTPEQIFRILTDRSDPHDAVDALIAAAMHGQSTDNITAIVADVVASDSVDSQPIVAGAALTGGPLPQMIHEVVDSDLPLEAADLDDADSAGPSDVGLVSDAGGVGEAGPAHPSNADTADAYDGADGLPEPAQAAGGSHPVSGASPGPDFQPDFPPEPQPEFPPDPVALLPVEPLDDVVGVEDEEQRLSRPRWAAIITTLAVIALGIAGFLGYQWTQSQYFIGVSDGYVTIFRGIPQRIGPFDLSTPLEVSTTPVEDLPDFFSNQLDGTITAESLTDARVHMQRLIDEALPATETPGGQ